MIQIIWMLKKNVRTHMLSNYTSSEITKNHYLKRLQKKTIFKTTYHLEARFQNDGCLWLSGLVSNQ